jgi:hypothetical protein
MRIPNYHFTEYETSSFVKARLDEMNISWEPLRVPDSGFDKREKPSGPGYCFAC